MIYTARCAHCLDTSSHCACRQIGNQFWAPGYPRVEDPCECFVCKPPAKVQSFRCHCGKLIICDDSKLETHHEAPICDWFRTEVEASGGKRAGALIVTDQGSERVKPQ